MAFAVFEKIVEPGPADLSRNLKPNIWLKRALKMLLGKKCVVGKYDAQKDAIVGQIDIERLLLQHIEIEHAVVGKW